MAVEISTDDRGEVDLTTPHGRVLITDVSSHGEPTRISIELADFENPEILVDGVRYVPAQEDPNAKT